LFDAKDGKIAILSYSYRKQNKMSKTNTKNKKTLYWSLKCPLGYLICTFNFLLKVPKREIFDHSDFHDFYAIKSLTVSDFGVKIKICLKNI